MHTDKIFESNRAAWNQATAYHQRARGGSLEAGFANPAFTTLNRDCDDVLMNKLAGWDLAGKTIAQLPCNNGRELLSLMRLGAARAIGFDISDAAVEEAGRLAAISGQNAEFVRTNILDIGDAYNGILILSTSPRARCSGFPTWMRTCPLCPGCSRRAAVS